MILELFLVTKGLVTHDAVKGWLFFQGCYDFIVMVLFSVGDQPFGAAARVNAVLAWKGNFVALVVVAVAVFALVVVPLSHLVN